MPAALRPRALTPDELQAALPAPPSETAAARAQRTDSRTVFSNMSPTDAVGVLKRKASEIVDRPAWRGPAAPAAARIVRYENGERSASIESATGEHLLLSSPLPLRVSDEDTGQLAAVDLGLERRAAGFETVNSFVDVTFPDDLSEGLQIGSLRIRVGGGAEQASAATQVGDTVAWANALVDTDVIANAVPQGAEFTTTLRSAVSPEDIPVALELPAGLTVRPSAFDDANQGGLAIVDGQQQTVGTITAPVAWDADHTAVQSEWRQTGDQLILHTSHVGKDLHYPIVVDPVINYGLSDANLAGVVMRGYPWAREDDTAARIDPFYGTSGWGTGLYQRIILPAGATRHYDVPAGAFWYLSLAGRQANIRSLQVANMRQDQGVGAGNNVLGSCTFMRVLAPSGAADFGGQLMQCGTYSGFSTNLGSGASPGTTGNTAQIGMLPSQTGDYHYFQQFIGALGVVLEDTSPRAAPTMSGGAPTWTNALSVPTTITARNTGLGVRAVGVAADGATSFSWQAADPSDPQCVVCPTSVTQTRTITGLPDGVRTLRAASQDQWATTGPPSPSIIARLDRAAPTINTLSGTLYDNRATTFGDVRAIRIPLSGEGSTASLAERRSGVRQIRLLVDRTPTGSAIVADHKEFAQQDSWVPDNTGDTNVLRLDPSTLQPGTHTVNVDVGDWANNSRLQPSFTITTCSTGWTYGGPDRSVNTQAEASTLGAQLVSSPSWASLWQCLAVRDRNYMIASTEATSYSGWIQRVDLSGPRPPTEISADWASTSQEAAEVTWTTDGDPDISSDVYGSGLDEERTEYRYRRAGGSYTSWTSGIDGVIPISSVDEGDLIDVDIRFYDFGGRTTTTTRTVTIPNGNPTAHASAAFVIPLLCAAGACEAIGAGLAYGGAVALGWVTVENYRKDLKRVDSNAEIHVDRQSTNAGDSTSGNPETRGEYEARVKSERNKLRRQAEASGQVAKGDGQDAHHIVAATAKRASYARDVMWLCKLDPNDWLTNGTPLHRKYHGKLHTNAYYDSINRVLKRYDPRVGKGDPSKRCDELAGENGLKAALRDIARYLQQGRWPF